MKALQVIAFFLFASLTCFSQSFSTKSYSIDGTAVQIIVADFNGDHIPDIATVNGDTNSVSVLINNGDGTFRPHLDFATGPGPTGLAAVDWNKDGKMDLVVSNGGASSASHSVSILLGNGDGTFQPHHEMIGAPHANSIAVGDFNGDGNPDIATSSNSPVNAVLVTLGNGKGEMLGLFQDTGNIGINPRPPNANAFLLTKIVRADFNHDGKDDLYYIECCNTFVIVQQGAFGVLVSNGDGSFSDRPISGPIVPPTDLFTTDINQDGLTDAILPSNGCHEPCIGAGVLINKGDGTFGGGAGLELGDTGFLVGGAVFDVDGNGHKDFVLVGVDSNDPAFNPDHMTLIIQKQNADGTFASPPQFEGDPSSQLITVTLNAPIVENPSTVVADFNHDGKPDLAIVSKFGGNVFVVLNTTPPSACKISTLNHTVTVCHPSDGAVGLSPAHIVSHFTSSTGASVSQIYLDNKLVFQVAGGNIDKKLALAPGEHRLEVKSWTKGQPFHNDFFLSTPRSIPATVPPCSESTNFAVNICSPGQEAAVDAPVHVVAAAKSTAPITTMQIYLDFKEVFHSPNSTLIETDVPMGSGSHLLVVKAFDSTGRHFSSSRNITVP